MRKGKRRLNNCGRIMSIVILMSFLKFPVFGDPLTEQPPNLNESGTRLWSDLEIDLLIEEISEAALEAIEQAAGEAAKAAVLSMVEREAAMLREMQHWRLEAENNALAIQAARQAGRKNILLAALIGILGGLAVGVGIQNLRP